MKVAKVDSTRVAVVSKKLNGSRVVLYASSPNKNFKDGTVEKVVTRRVESANRLYGVFFRFIHGPELPTESVSVYAECWEMQYPMSPEWHLDWVLHPDWVLHSGRGLRSGQELHSDQARARRRMFLEYVLF